jgi:hypothetical protein
MIDIPRSGSSRHAEPQPDQLPFGQPITLQRLGPEYRLRLGTPDAQIPLLNRPTREYAAAEAALPVLGEQGHGMRSFLGLALLLLVQSYPVVLIDEPEAFLHPPQRRALGRLIGTLAKSGDSQLFISTHDTEFLWGLLDSSSDVTVIRLTREGNINQAKQISASRARLLWADPLLRYSRIFDGLFYNRVVVAESDSDCRFYSAVADHLAESSAIARPDVQFVPAGGKDRVHVAISALREVGVDCVAAVDFDVLRDEGSLRRLVEAAGGNWSELVGLRTVFAGQISQKRIGKPVLGLRKTLDELLPSDDKVLDRDTSKKVIELFSYKDGWEEAKKSGLAAVPAGDANRACRDFIEKLALLGVYVLPEGELESFVRTVSGHGPKWVSEVLSQKLHITAREAHEFVRRIISPEGMRSEA